MNDAREKIVTVRRTLAAGRAFLFAAWTDPELFAQWFGPRSWTIERCEVDARVGGQWRAWFRRADGGEVYAGGTYLDIDPPGRVVFTWHVDPAGSAADALSVVSVTLSETEGGTAIEINHRKLGTTHAVDMDVGWNNTLDALEDFVSARAIAIPPGDTA
ncbi:MAG: SRPBCC domain-containing protein [Acetobacteraceae bacterium]